MKKFISLILAISMLFTGLVQVAAADTTSIYVSVNGSDENPGTLAEPVASLAKACELAAGGNATIYMMGGNYKAEKGAELKNVSNVTIRNYNNEEVVITGAENIDATLFTKVTDTAVLDRVIESKAKQNLVSVNLTELGIKEFGSLYMKGFNFPGSPSAPQFVVDEEAQTLARYPDNDYLYISNIVKGDDTCWAREPGHILGNKDQFHIFNVADTRLSKWKQADDIWFNGFPVHDWADAIMNVTIDFEKNNEISTEYPTPYGIRAEGRLYFMNLLEEISMPGEWYLDRTTGILYTYPDKAFTKDTAIYFVTFSDSFIAIEDAENITIKGIDFSYGLGNAINATNTKKVTVTECDFDHVSATVINVNQSFDTVISWCNFEEIGGTGVDMDNGVSDTLTPGNSIITNCVFDGFQRVQTTGTPGIAIWGVGNTVSHCVMTDAPYIAIRFDGNNHVIEYNDISNVCQDTADTGAIYAGRHWEDRGNEIRYNYIHDIKIIDTNTGMKVQAIYLDDGFSSANVHGNIIKDVPSVALFGGGRHNTFENNIVINCEEPFVFDERYLTWDQTEIMGYLKATPYTSDVWKEAYPELQNILEDEPGAPKYNTIRNNVSYNAPGYTIYDAVKQYAIAIEPDYELKDTNEFVDFRGGDLTLKEDSEVFTALPDFKPIDFKAIGLEEKPAEKTADDVLKGSVVLKVGTADTYVFGNKTKVDPDNAAVMPQIINDRTLVPVRFIAESLGGEVSWDDATKKVGIVFGDKTIELVLNDTKLSVNGEVTTLDVPAQSIEGRTMLPLRAVTESLGMNVFWDNAGLIVVSEGEILTQDDAELVKAIIAMF